MTFEELYQDIYPPLVRYCTRLTGNGDDGEEVAQEAFVRLLKGGVTGHPAGLRVWLFRTALHRIRDAAKVRANRQRLLEIHPVLPGGDSHPGLDLERQERIESVRKALERLSPRDRELLLLREEGFSYREMAEAVGVAGGSVGTLLARAQRRLTEHLNEEDGDDAS
ncbi:MAG: sigma-70 family RNA polymerase sigma factor [Gemmatimonadota bacterium]